MTLRTAVALLLACLYLVGCGLFGFKDDRVRDGEAYGFTIGESFAETLSRAKSLKVAGGIHEIQIGSGSSAVPLDEVDQEAGLSQELQLVVDPDVWNDTIYLSFSEGSLVEIWRFRSPTELP